MAGYDFISNSKAQSISWETDSCSARRIFPVFFTVQRSITMFTRVHHSTLNWTNWIHSKLSRPISVGSISLYRSTRRSSLQVSRLKFCMLSSSTPCPYTHLQFNPPWFDQSDNIIWRVQITKFIIIYFSPSSSFVLCLRRVITLYCEILFYLNGSVQLF